MPAHAHPARLGLVSALMPYPQYSPSHRFVKPKCRCQYAPTAANDLLRKQIVDLLICQCDLNDWLPAAVERLEVALHVGGEEELW